MFCQPDQLRKVREFLVPSSRFLMLLLLPGTGSAQEQVPAGDEFFMFSWLVPLVQDGLRWKEFCSGFSEKKKKSGNFC